MREAIQAEDPAAEVVGILAEKRLEVTTSLDDSRLNTALEKAGYPASSEPDSPTVPESPPEATEVPATTGTNLRLAISGMTCASCVKSVQNALKNTQGVEAASVNFATHTAQVVGSADAQALINAVSSAGYTAEPIVDMREAERVRAEQDATTYRQRLRGSVIALAFAIPLMLSMFIYHPHVMGLGRVYWLVIGLLTLGVLAFPGRHFFVNAWKNLKRHQANMDTLVAMGTGTAWLYSMAVVLFAPWLPRNRSGDLL